MNYEDIIGEHLKCDFLNDLFETYDVEVVYHYDRTYENIQDEYRASLEELGLEFLFNSSQKLISLFMSNYSHKGYNPFTGNDPRKVEFSSGSEAMSYADSNKIKADHQPKKADSFLGPIPEWVKFNFHKYSIHYEFSDSGVKLVTLQSIEG